jgi:hypothetical protein
MPELNRWQSSVNGAGMPHGDQAIVSAPPSGGEAGMAVLLRDNSVEIEMIVEVK